MIFTDDAIPHIIGVKPPDPHAGLDTCIWRWTEHNDFELKSAYYRWLQPVLEDPDPLWSHIWRIQVPQRNHCFLWLAGRQKLMTNMERCKHALTDDPFCPLCRDAEESVLHTLRDCVNMQRIWKQAIPRSLSPTFFSKPMKDWLRQNLCTNIMSHINIPWKLVFASILWQSWKNRNDAMFAANSESPNCVLSRSIGLAHYYYDGWLQPQPTIHPSMPSSSWISPEPGWLCLNVDGALWRKAWFIDIIWTPRSGNKAADKLAKLADFSSFDTTFFSSPPAELLDILASDNLAIPL
ncbi:hypothetical protein V6N11_025752 [Hibiscus sabdariffa]|uniref:Reverse transcriptase zinc-binding domain-containing protein n=1 Tax=Hibiscus sabdariffa TaxID=183260 RepID=A0ABR2SUH0_9ROSI